MICRLTTLLHRAVQSQSHAYVPILDICSPNPCLNHGRCIKHSVYLFECICVDGYKGIYCESSKETNQHLIKDHSR